MLSVSLMYAWTTNEHADPGFQHNYPGIQAQADQWNAGWDVGILGDREQNIPPMKV